MENVIAGMGADVNLVNAAGQSPLNRAIRGGRLHEAYELLRLGQSTRERDRLETWTMTC
jgi:ankyrin repeat protein